MTTHTILKQYFGYDIFRPGQEELINDILAGKDVLGVMPTGAGKSLCFQVPALIMEGLTLIVSPLISLMKDQVNALNQSGAAAAYINSSLNEKQIHKALQNACNNLYKLIYVAPERLESYDFLDFARSANISMLTIDEAHCISQWGHDFRPSYSKIPEFIAKLQNRPVISAFTATATPHVRDDVINLLQLKEPTVLGTGFDRPNLYFEVKKPKDKFSELITFLQDKKEQSGIIYCSTRAAVEEVCDGLKQKGYNASRYHAGLSDLERHDNQDDFIYDRVQIMVATNAFGMGIDKSNVAFVLHYNMPKDMESYYQEAGRAGRDGSPADCVLLYSGQDVRTSLWLIENAREYERFDKPEGEISREQILERDRARLREMTFYCSTYDCLRGYILKYFGETPPPYCGRCENCNTNFEATDVTVDAQKILSCVVRMRERYGVNLIIDTLRGSKNERILRLGLDRLSTYGICEQLANYKKKIQTAPFVN
jgi:ATP-dependent DNA helicase RecQ